MTPSRLLAILSLVLVFGQAGTAQGTGDPAPVAPPKPQEKPPVDPQGEPARPPRRAPRQDPKAVDLFKAMAAKIDRPRDHGLNGIRFKVVIRVTRGQELKSSDPLFFEWDGKGYRILGADGTPSRELPPQSPLAYQIVFDMVGYDSFGFLSMNDFEMDADGSVKVITPEWAANPNAPSHLIFKPDAEGRVGLQKIVMPNGSGVERSFEFAPRGEKWTIVTSRTSGDKPYVTNYEREEFQGFYLPKSVVTITAQGRQEVLYSEIELNPTFEHVKQGPQAAPAGEGKEPAKGEEPAEKKQG